MEDAVDKILNDPESGFTKPGAKPEEKPAGPVVEQPKAPEPKPEEKPVEQPTQWEFKLDEFNKKYGLNFENEDSLKTFFEKGNKVSELETELSGLKEQLPYYQQVEQTLREFADANDPLKKYGSQEAYKQELAIQKLSDGRNGAIVTEVVKSDLSKMSPLELLVLKRKFDSPSIVGQTAAIKEAILEEVGVNISAWEEENEGKRFNTDNPELTPKQQVKLASMADMARSELNTLKNNVEVPEFKSPLEGLKEQVKVDQEKKDQNLKSWGEQGNRIAGEMSKLQKFVKDKDGKDTLDFEFEIDQSFKSDIKQMVVDYVKDKNIEPTQENVDEVKDLVMFTYLKENWDKVLDAYGKERESRVTQKTDQEVTNNQPINKEEPPPSADQNDVDRFNEAVQKMFEVK